MKSERGFITTLVDRFTARQFGLPPETCSYTITDVCIPVSKGVDQFELAADLYEPVLADGENPAGTILIRTPYSRGVLFAICVARPFAARGYNVLFVSSRGHYGSGSAPDPWRKEEDGQAFVEWMRKQVWYTGTFATWGCSYLGYVQWALLQNPPPDLVAAVIQCAPHDFSKQLWSTGSLALEWVGWTENITHQEDTGWFRTFDIYMTKRMRPVVSGVPLSNSVKLHFNGAAPWLDFVVDHPDTSDPCYDQMELGKVLERTDIPVFLVGSLYDLFAPQTLTQYARVSERKMNVKFLLGPWTHMEVILSTKVYRQSFDWLEEHLAKRKMDTDLPSVQYCVTGETQEWRNATNWPPTTAHHMPYLRSSNRLQSRGPEVGEEPFSTFVYDPSNPTPTIGGNLLSGGGCLDDTAFEARSGILAFTTEPLEDSLVVLGKISVELNHTSDNVNVDLSVRISDADVKGRSHNITETYKRLTSKLSQNLVTLHLNDCAHRFAKGHRIRLTIAGASFAQYEFIAETAVHIIHHGRERVSKVLLPVAIEQVIFD